MNRIRKGDTVIVTTGKNKKIVSKVLSVIKDKLIVENVNKVTEFVKANPNANEPGGIRQREALINISNVAIYNDKTEKADKVGFKFIDENGVPKKVRYFKSNGELIDVV